MGEARTAEEDEIYHDGYDEGYADCEREREREPDPSVMHRELDIAKRLRKILALKPLPGDDRDGEAVLREAIEDLAAELE